MFIMYNAQKSNFVIITLLTFAILTTMTEGMKGQELCETKRYQRGTF